MQLGPFVSGKELNNPGCKATLLQESTTLHICQAMVTKPCSANYPVMSNNITEYSAKGNG